MPLEAAFGQLRPAAARFAAKERKPYKPVKDEEEDWLPEKDELCEETRALNAWAPTMTVASDGNSTVLKLKLKACHTVDRPAGESTVPVALRLYSSGNGRWGLIVATVKGAEKSSVTLVQYDNRQAWRTSAHLGEKSIKDLLSKCTDCGTITIEKFPSGVGIQTSARLRIVPEGAESN